jgi:hypothetical protein
MLGADYEPSITNRSSGEEVSGPIAGRRTVSRIHNQDMREKLNVFSITEKNNKLSKKIVRSCVANEETLISKNME